MNWEGMYKKTGKIKLKMRYNQTSMGKAINKDETWNGIFMKLVKN